MSGALWLVATACTALVMGTALGHALEMPAKMSATAAQWLTYQQTLYPYFARVGGALEMTALASVALLAYRARADRDLGFAAAVAFVLLALAFFGVWLGFTNPANARVATWRPDSIPADWARWRTQWEYSHLVRFVLQCIAFLTLLGPALRARQ